MARDAGLIAGRQIASHEFIDLHVDGGAVECHAAVCPFDLAVARGNVRLGQYDEFAFESALLRELLDHVEYIEKTIEDRLGSTVSSLAWLGEQLDDLRGVGQARAEAASAAPGEGPAPGGGEARR